MAAERTASNPWTGEWQGATYDYEIADIRRELLGRLASVEDRYWVGAQQVFMTTRANRAAKGIPYTVFTGPMIDAQPSGDLRWRITLGDVISRSILSDQHQIPWRQIGDGFLSALAVVSEHLDREGPEPIIYGEHRRVPDDPPSPHGFQFTPIYLGIESAVGSPLLQYHVWLVAGHACAGLPNVLVWTENPDGSPPGPTFVSVLADPDWLIPHTSAPAYEDRVSDTYPTMTRRYTLVRGLVGNVDADACANGEKTLTVFVDGVEPSGFGSGDVITDRFLQYQHFLINYVAHVGPDSYHTGAWLTNPEWDLEEGPTPIIDEDSFATCQVIGEERLPVVGSPQDYPAGYIGTAIIGAASGDRSSVLRWIADWNRSCGAQFVITNKGQIRLFMLHPTQAIKDAAPLYTASYEMLKGRFQPDVRWWDQANRIPFRTDYHHTTGIWTTVGVSEDLDAIRNYGRPITSDPREYPFAPGITMANHLAVLERRVRVHPPIFVPIDESVGHDANNKSIAYLEAGDYLRYEHFAAVGAPGQIRLAQIHKCLVWVGERIVGAVAFDCEDLIDFDAPDPGVL